MMSNQTEAMRSSATARQDQIVDPTKSGSNFYSVPDPYEEGRKRAAEAEKKRSDHRGNSKSDD